MLRELELRPLNILEVDLAGVARGVAAGFGASHRVAVDVPEGTVATDRDLVIEILTDLLGHALENAPDGSNVTICADSEKSGCGCGSATTARGSIRHTARRSSTASSRSTDPPSGLTAARVSACISPGT
jgi:signal transduction histidine kinase